MMRFRETKVVQENFYGARKPINIKDVNADHIIISKLAEIKTDSKYLFGYLDKFIKPSVLISSKMSGI